MMRQCLFVCAAALAAARAGAQNDVVLRAMHDELDRTMSALRVGQLEKPYFVSYRIREGEAVTASAQDGALLSGHWSRGGRHLEVEVRVGDYAFDNTNAIAMGRMGNVGFSSRSFGGETLLPRDDDYLEIRRQIWLATDAAYKQALEALAAKRAAVLNRTQRTTLADFSHEPPTQTTDTTASAPMPELARVDSLAQALSRPTSNAIYAARASVVVTADRVRYVNSEGTSYVARHPLVAVTASASTQAADGMRLSDAAEWYASRFDELPARDTLAARVATMQRQLDSLRAAPAFDHYDGPVVFEGKAAAELFGAEFMPFLVTHRSPVMDNAQAEEFFSQMMDRMGALTEKIGGRVMPEFMSVTDDPTATTAAGVPLLGGYVVDEEGVRARRTVVIDSGFLETLLSTRTPVRGVEHSTGNRREGEAAPSNLIVSAANGVTDSALVDHMLAIVKRRRLPYGIIVRALSEADASDPESFGMDMMNAGDPLQRSHGLARAFRVYPDGRLELIRGAYLTGFSTSSFKDILAASLTPTVLTFGTLNADMELMMGPQMGMVNQSGMAMSLAVPSLLFEDVSLTTGRGALPRPPISAPPT